MNKATVKSLNALVDGIEHEHSVRVALLTEYDNLKRAHMPARQCQIMEELKSHQEAIDNLTRKMRACENEILRSAR